MTTTTTVRHLRPGQVMSLPEAGREPALIEAISSPVGDVRFIDLLDLTDGEPVDSRLVLGVDRQVVVHDVEALHHRYTNIDGAPIEISLGRRVETVAPGDSVHYTGAANPAVFDLAQWEHHAEPVVVAAEERPL